MRNETVEPLFTLFELLRKNSVHQPLLKVSKELCHLKPKAIMIGATCAFGFTPHSKNHT